ncbi:MAG: hypothetical protein M1826_006727 [Phylliscum demangeonii]|nr:MAG: hypothetical protein M1826_006727 [Phylliscum demangeonii]
MARLAILPGRPGPAFLRRATGPVAHHAFFRTHAARLAPMRLQRTSFNLQADAASGLAGVVQQSLEEHNRALEARQEQARERAHSRDLSRKTNPTADVVHALEETMAASDLERQAIRRWRPGDVYAPHDLSPAETRKIKRRTPPKTDVVDILGVDPLREYKNYSILTEFITHAGRIKHSAETGLRAVNQRKMAKAIRRAIGLGLYPSVHHHPEILQTRALKLTHRRTVMEKIAI